MEITISKRIKCKLMKIFKRFEFFSKIYSIFEFQRYPQQVGPKSMSSANYKDRWNNTKKKISTNTVLNNIKQNILSPIEQ